MMRLTELLWGKFIQTEENSSNPRLPDLLVQLTSDHLVRGDPALDVHPGVMRDNCRSLNTELELSSSVHRSIAVQAGI
jgi:hypothetical protein